jgi:SSS family solute:Na+ symporter
MESFYLAGRNLPWSLTVGTLVATWYGASGTIAVVETGFIYGFSIWLLWCFTAHIGRLPMALIVGPRVHMTTSLTVPDMLKSLYGKRVAFWGAILMCIYCIQIQEVTALGVIGETTWGIDANLMAIAIVAISLLLTVLGGLLSVAVTDMILFFFMCVGLTIVLPIAWHDFGGIEKILTSISTLGASHFIDAGGVESYMSASSGVSVSRTLTLVIIALAAYADPAFYQRFSAADSPQSASRALLMSLVIWLAFDFVLVAMGFLTKAVYPDLPPGVGYIKLTLSYLPVGLRAMFIIGLLGSIVSTLDSYYLTGGSTLANDIIVPLMKIQPSQRMLLNYSRLGSIIIGIVGLLVATQFSRVIEAYIFLCSLYTSVALVPIVAGILWKGKRTMMGGFLAMIAGLVTFSALYFLGIQDTLIYSLPASIIGFVIGNCIGKDRREGNKSYV